MRRDLSTCTTFVAETHETRGVNRAVREVFSASEFLNSHASAVVGRFIYVTGGYYKSVRMRKGVYVLDTADWSWSQWTLIGELSEGFAVSEHSMVLVDDRIFAFSGSSDQYRGWEPLQMYAMDVPLKTFAPHRSRNERLIPRGAPAAVYVEKKRLVVAYGGFNQRVGQVSNQLVGYDVSANAWAKLNVKGGRPTPRRGLCACMHGDCDVIFYGGENEREESVSTVNVLRCNSSSFVWSEVLFDPMPYAASHASMCCVGDRLIIYGGFQDVLTLAASSALYVYNVRTRKGKMLQDSTGDVFRATGGSNLSELQLQGVMEPSAAHTAVLLGSKMIVVGGLYKQANSVTVLSTAQ